MTPDSPLRLAVAEASAVAAALVLHTAGYFVLRRIAGHLPTAAAVVERSRRASRVVLVVIGVASAWSAAAGSTGWSGAVSHGLAVAQIAAVAWLVINVVLAAEEIGFHRYDVNVADNLRARKLRTQILVMRRISVAVIAILATAAALLTFHGIRAVGTSLLASAGIAGLVAGTAARPVLGNFIAGIQLAFTEPIRLDDVVVVQGNFGRVEEITITYVVLQLWDRRRMVLPVSYFIDNPFENWTRNSADLIGSVYLYLDYSAPVPALREEMQRIVKASPRWDGRTAVLQVTDATERTVQIRALVSARDSGSTFDLRCEVREGLVEWVQRNHPQALPHDRVLSGPDPIRPEAGDEWRAALAAADS